MNTYEEEQLQKYKPEGSTSKTSTEMSVGDWLITMLIMIIPIANLVMLFIWGFGNPDPRRNYARATLIWMAISIVLTILLYAIIFFFVISATNGMN
ncbi:hypothetical protein MKZ20_00600 [Psychrobacillus sp. FSL K6-2684]|uniref:hypothetical protein n=1 Tax=Psychrobacillus sp. FSL K6-2684 TaxID=2921547 RepID=UPI0030FA04E6